MEFLERQAIGKADALTLTAAMSIDHVRSRRGKGAGPATVANDLIWMGVVLRAAKSVRELPVRPEIVKEARNACAELRLTGKARKRARRPTPEELKRLSEYFVRRDRRSTIPMRSVMEFALNSARRESEICRLEWRDNDAQNQTGMVRDAKHPTAREGNHRRFKYTPEAWAIVKAQPRTSAYIFPYDPRSIGAAFTRACHLAIFLWIVLSESCRHGRGYRASLFQHSRLEYRITCSAKPPSTRLAMDRSVVTFRAAVRVPSAG